MNRLKSLREESGLLQSDIAKTLGITPQAIGLYENGKRDMPTDVVVKLSNYFNTTADYILGIASYKNKQQEIEIEHKIITFLDKLSQFEIAFLEKLIDSAFGPNGLMVKSETFLIENFTTTHLNSSEKDFLMKQLCTHFKENYSLYPFSHGSHHFSTLVFKELTRLDDKNYHGLYSFSKGNWSQIPVLGKIATGQPLLTEEYLEGYLPVDPNVYGLSTSEELFYLKVSGESMNQRVKNGDYALIQKQNYAEDGDIIVAIVNGDDEATLKRYKRLNDQFVLLEPMSTDPSIGSITVDLKQSKFYIIGKAIGQFGKF